MKPIAIYARVSTDHQNTEMQLNELRNYCSQRRFAIYDEYIDNGISGSKTSRPELNRMMVDVRRRKVDAVLVWKFDRFARSTSFLINSLNEFNSLGVDFISLHESVDTSNSMGKLVFTIFAAIGEFERSLIRERILAGMRNTDKKIGRKKVQVDSRQVMMLRNKGKSIRKIAKKLKVSVGTIHSICKKNITG